MSLTAKTRILEYLKCTPSAVVSGESLSRELGISRTAVWKYIKEFRQKGYIIEASTRTGYRLKYSPDLLLPEELHLGLSTSLLGKTIHYHYSVASTNQLASRLARKDEVEGTLVVAEEQTRGKGRRGREWHSPPAKGIWFSLLLYPRELSPGQVAPFTAAAATVIVRSLKQTTGAPVSIKWPNDLLLAGKKTGGILAEIKGDQEQVQFLVLGVGININQEEPDFPRTLKPVATSLLIETGQKFRRAEVCCHLLHELEKGYMEFLQEGFAPFRSEWKKHNTTLGKQVTVSTGSRQIQGMALDIDYQGALLLDKGTSRPHRITFGEITNGQLD